MARSELLEGRLSQAAGKGERQGLRKQRSLDRLVKTAGGVGGQEKAVRYVFYFRILEIVLKALARDEEFC